MRHQHGTYRVPLHGPATHGNSDQLRPPFSRSAAMTIHGVAATARVHCADVFSSNWSGRQAKLAFGEAVSYKSDSRKRSDPPRGRQLTPCPLQHPRADIRNSQSRGRLRTCLKATKLLTPVRLERRASRYDATASLCNIGYLTV